MKRIGSNRKKYQMGAITSREVGAEQTLGATFFKPDFALLDKALAARQQRYDDSLAMTKKLKAKVNEVPTLEGYDRNRHFELQDELDTDIRNVKGLYGGDLSKAGVELEGLIDKVAGLFDIHGEMTALSNRYKGYSNDQKRLSEMYEKGDITKGQMGALEIELARTREIGIGQNNRQWNSWQTVNAMKAIKEEEFIQKFLEQKNKDSEHKWGQGKRVNSVGKLEYRGAKDTWISEEEARAEAKAAFLNAAERTGQLTADYNYLRWQKANRKYDVYVNTTLEDRDYYNQSYETHQNAYKKALSMLDGEGRLTGKELQQYMNEQFNTNLSIDGKEGTITEAARQANIARIQKALNMIEAEKSKIDNMSEQEYAAYDMLQWRNQYLDKAVRPYSETVSFNEHEEGLKVYDDTYLEFDLKRRLMREQHGYDVALAKLQWDWENPIVPALTMQGDNLTVANPYGKDLQEFEMKYSTLSGDYNDKLNDMVAKLGAWAKTVSPDEVRAFSATPMGKLAMRIAAGGTDAKKASADFVRMFSADNMANARVLDNGRGGIQLQIRGADGQNAVYDLPLTKEQFGIYKSSAQNYLQTKSLWDQRREEAVQRALNNDAEVDIVDRNGQTVTRRPFNEDERELYRSLDGNTNTLKELMNRYNESTGNSFTIYQTNAINAAIMWSKRTEPNSKIDYDVVKDNYVNGLKVKIAVTRAVDEDFKKQPERYEYTPLISNAWATENPKVYKALQDQMRTHFNGTYANNQLGVMQGVAGGKLITMEEAKKLAIEAVNGNVNDKTAIVEIKSDVFMANSGSGQWVVPITATNTKTGKSETRFFYTENDITGIELPLNFKQKLELYPQRKAINEVLEGSRMGLEKYKTQYNDPITGKPYSITYQYKKDQSHQTDITESPSNKSKHDTFTATIEVPIRDKNGRLTGETKHIVLENEQAFRYRSQIEFDNILVNKSKDLGIDNSLLPFVVATYKSMMSDDGRTFQGHYQDPNVAANRLMDSVNQYAARINGGMYGARLHPYQAYELLGLDQTGTSYRSGGKIIFNNDPTNYGVNESTGRTKISTMENSDNNDDSNDDNDN